MFPTLFMKHGILPRSREEFVSLFINGLVVSEGARLGDSLIGCGLLGQLARVDGKGVPDLSLAVVLGTCIEPNRQGAAVLMQLRRIVIGEN